jgi:hypothetical protein
MITIKMRDGKWRITITEETFEFPDKKSCLDTLEDIAEFKDKFGRIKE